MVKLTQVRESNAAVHASCADQISLFVGATSGLSLATLTEYARCSTRPKVYIVGRSEARLTAIIADLKKLNPNGTFLPIIAECALLRNVDAACAELKAKETSLNLLVVSPGCLKSTRQDNADGLEESISLRYYVRMRFAQNLLPLLTAAPVARIMSIHGAGKEGRLIESDLELRDHYGMRNAAMHTSTMTTLALAELAAQYPTLSCVHVFPGVVVTKNYYSFFDDWSLPWRILFKGLVVPSLKFAGPSVSETGERMLFHVTSVRYAPAGDKFAAGYVALPKGVKALEGCESGYYNLNWDGEVIGDEKLLQEYRERDMGSKIWQHTQEVFDRVLKPAT